jgi:glycosyltransferase involved in cell wall biosynthesis
MHIGIITGEYPPMQGGVGDYSRELARALVAGRHAVSVLTSRPHRADPASAIDVPDGVHVTATIDNWNHAVWGAVQAWVNERQPEVINVQYEAAAFKMAALVHSLPILLRKYPIVTTYHDLLVPYLFPKAGPLRYQALMTLAKTSEAVIVTNRQDEVQLEREAGIKALHNIPIGSNIADQPPPDYQRTAWRTALNLPADALLGGYFGFLNISKGVDTLLHAAAEAIRGGLPLYLLMIGGNTGSSDVSNSDHARTLDTLIADLNLDAALRWTGYVDNPLVSANLRAVDMLLLPYRDGVSYRRGSFMAGLAHGCPIITTHPSTDLPELRHAHNVWLVPPADAPALARAVGTLAADGGLRARLGDGARQLATTFTWDRIATQAVSVFEQAIRGKR